MHIIADGFGQNILPEERGPWNFVHLLYFFPIGKPISKCTKFKMATANKDAFIDKPHRFQTLLNRDCNDRPSQTPDTSEIKEPPDFEEIHIRIFKVKHRSLSIDG